ncbi:SEL1-like repeat protein [Actinomadura verrucosospora]|uniref:Tetratricopeptide repeat-containing protein n=1 Tax=Actinomadura verrucosospora TaxID=46165 RepID=A0A7D3VSM0_ACTVE|nr:SEL1-like repeat protein [Actinomadura verrucosospora]QKG19794.1 tetratricopeptide repeat-containing protein [Actinomadura verrucosospora]
MDENTGIDALIGRAEALLEAGDDKEAERLLRRAADLGGVAAMTTLGVVIECRERIAEAIHWYRRAAENGDRDAMAALRACTTTRAMKPRPGNGIQRRRNWARSRRW